MSGAVEQEERRIQHSFQVSERKKAKGSDEQLRCACASASVSARFVLKAFPSLNSGSCWMTERSSDGRRALECVGCPPPPLAFISLWSLASSLVLASSPPLVPSHLANSRATAGKRGNRGREYRESRGEMGAAQTARARMKRSSEMTGKKEIRKEEITGWAPEFLASFLSRLLPPSLYGCRGQQSRIRGREEGTGKRLSCSTRLSSWNGGRKVKE